MALLYKGYAQQKGFGSYQINVPDPAEKIRRQGLEAIAAQKDSIAWNRRVANTVSSAMANNARLEAKVRADNERLRQFHRDTIGKARKQQQDQAIRNEVTRRQNEKIGIENVRSVLQLTKAGIGLLQKHDQNQKAKADVQAQQWFEDHGFTSVDLHALNSIDRHVWEKGRRDTAIYKDLKARGAQEEDIDFWYNLNGRQKLAVQRLGAREEMRGRGDYYEANLNTKVLIRGQEYDLATARDAGNINLGREILRQLDLKRREELGDAYPDAKLIHTSGAFEFKQQGVTAQLQIISQQQRKNAHGKRHEDEQTIIKDELTYVGVTEGDKYADDGQALLGSLYLVLGENPEALPKGVKNARTTEWANAVADMVVNQKTLRPDQIESLFKTDFTPLGAQPNKKGEFPVKKFGEFMHTPTRILEGAVSKRRLEDLALENSKVKGMQADGIRTRFDVEEILKNSKNLTYETINDLRVALQKKPPEIGGPALKLLDHHMKSREVTINDDSGQAVILDRIANHEDIKHEDLLKLNLSDRKLEGLWKLAQANNPTLPSDDERKKITTHVGHLLENKLPRLQVWKSPYSLGPATDGAVFLATSAYKAARQSDETPEKALEYALEKVNSAIAKPDGDWGIKTGGPFGPQFAGFVTSTNNNDVIVVDHPAIYKLVNENPNAIYTNSGLLNEGALKKLSTQVSQGMRPALLNGAIAISDHTQGHIKPIHVMQAQIGLIRQKEIKETGVATTQELPDWYVKNFDKTEFLDPRAHKYLCTPQAVNKACLTRGKDGVQQPLVYLDHAIRNAGEIIGQESGQEYDAVIDNNNPYPGGNSVVQYGVKISDGTIGDVIKLADGRDLRVGAYKIDAKEGYLKEGMNLAGLSEADAFNKENQDKIFGVLFKKYGPTIWGTYEEMTEIEKLRLQRTWDIMNGKFDMSLGYHNAGAVSKVALGILSELGRYTTVEVA